MIVSVKYNIFLFFLILYFIFIYKKISYLIIPLVIICFLFLLSYLINNPHLPNISDVEGNYYIYDIDDKYYYLKGKYNIICYKKNENLDIGDEIECKINIYEWDNISYESEFDYRKYYQAKGIDYRGYINYYEVIGFKFSKNIIKNRILDMYSEVLNEKSYLYFKSLVFGINQLDNEVKDAYSSLYISHILAISGMHLMFIYNILIKLFRYILKIEGSLLSIIIVGIYLVIIGFPSAGLRAYLFLLLGYINNLDYIKYTKLDIFSISFIIMSLINPLMCYQNSFILSYLVSFLLIFISDILKTKSKLLNSIIISLLSILITFPFVVNMTNEINILNVFFS